MFNFYTNLFNFSREARHKMQRMNDDTPPYLLLLVDGVGTPLHEGGQIRMGGQQVAGSLPQPRR